MLWHSVWHPVWHVFGSRRGPTASGARDMARVRCPQSELAEEETRRRKRRKKEEEAEEGVAPLLKSRDPHLARGKNTGKNGSKLGVGEVLAGHWVEFSDQLASTSGGSKTSMKPSYLWPELKETESVFTSHVCFFFWTQKNFHIFALCQVPSGKHTKSYGKSPFFMGKSTINGHFQ